LSEIFFGSGIAFGAGVTAGGTVVDPQAGEQAVPQPP
jgi:hypothetical protein